MNQRTAPLWFRLFIVFVSFALYIIACLKPAALVIGGWIDSDSKASGLGVLLFGYSDGPRALLPWSSNFLWVISIVLLLRSRLGMAFLYASIGLLFAQRILLPYSGMVFLEAQYWWVASYVAMVVGSLICIVWEWTHATDEAREAS